MSRSMITNLLLAAILVVLLYAFAPQLFEIVIVVGALIAAGAFALLVAWSILSALVVPLSKLITFVLRLTWRRLLDGLLVLVIALPSFVVFDCAFLGTAADLFGDYPTGFGFWKDLIFDVGAIIFLFIWYFIGVDAWRRFRGTLASSSTMKSAGS
jgi:hypothetical protein